MCVQTYKRTNYLMSESFERKLNSVVLTLIKYFAPDLWITQKGSLLLPAVMDRKFVYLIFSSSFFLKKKADSTFLLNRLISFFKWEKSTLRSKQNLFNLYIVWFMHIPFYTPLLILNMYTVFINLSVCSVHFSTLQFAVHIRLMIEFDP